MKTVGTLIAEAQALARQSGAILSELQLPREDFDALKEECREFAIFPLSEADRYKFIYEPMEKVIYRGVEVTPAP